MAWETLVVELPKTYPHMQQVELDKHEGWELVTVVNNLAYFKRQKIEQTLPDYINSAQFEAMIRRAIGKELGLDQA